MVKSIELVILVRRMIKTEKCKWNVHIFRKDLDTGCAEEYTNYNTRDKLTEDELKDYIPTIKETFANTCRCTPKQILITYTPVPGTEEKIKIVDIHMITSYGDRYFTNIIKESFKLNSNGYFEFTLLNGQRQYVKDDTVFEYSATDHLDEGIENNGKNTETNGESNENVKE